MGTPRHTWRRLFLSVANGLVMLGLVFVAMRLPYAHGDEQAVVQGLSVARRVLLKWEEKPPKDNFLFIDTQYDIELIEAYDREGFPIGKQVITDRRLLGKLVQILNAYPDSGRFVLFDIHLLERSGAGDSLLQAQLPRTLGLLGTAIPTDTGMLRGPFRYPIAPAYYQPVGEAFYKYALTTPLGELSYPLAMLAAHDRQRVHTTWFTVNTGNHVFFRTLVPDFAIRSYDVLQAPLEQRYKYETLGNLLSGALTDSLVAAQLAGRTIVLGHFGALDSHQTLYGETAGALILLNTYLSLQNGEGAISVVFILFLLLAFSGISWLLLDPQEPTLRLSGWLERKTTWYRKLSGIVRTTLLEAITYPLLLLMVAVVSWLVFGVAVSVLYLVYLLFAERQLVVWRSRRAAAKAPANPTSEKPIEAPTEPVANEHAPEVEVTRPSE